MTARNGSPPSEELHSTERQSQRERETKKVLLLFYVLPCFPATFPFSFFIPLLFTLFIFGSVAYLVLHFQSHPHTDLSHFTNHMLSSLTQLQMGNDFIKQSGDSAEEKKKPQTEGKQKNYFPKKTVKTNNHKTQFKKNKLAVDACIITLTANIGHVLTG